MANAHPTDEMPLRERLAGWIAHLEHVLPAQAPIRDFVHHNTLHGFQHLPFADALAAAHRLTGARPYWPEENFRQCLAGGRITSDDLLAVIDETQPDAGTVVVPDLTRRAVLLASLSTGDDASAARRRWLADERAAADDPLLAACLAVLPPATPDGDAWPALAASRWAALCERVGRDWTRRRLLEHLTGEDVLAEVGGILQRHLAAHLDAGIAAWRNPARREGFYAAWRASAGVDLHWELDELPEAHGGIAGLPDDPLAVLAAELPQVVPDSALWPGYLERLALELPGWSGMTAWREHHPEAGDGTPVALADLLAVRVLLERLFCDRLTRRLAGAPLDFPALREHFQKEAAEFYVRDAWARGIADETLASRAAHAVANAGLAAVDWKKLAKSLAEAPVAADAGEAWRLAALCRELGCSAADVAGLGCEGARALLDCAAGLGPLQRGDLWLRAYERHYREQLFVALAANAGRPAVPARPSAQVVCCMDDREEGTRRHLEEIAPDIVTYGAAGFFGVAMYWQGLDDAARTALCPVVVRPTHLVREMPAAGRETAAGAHAARRERRLAWRDRLYQATRRHALAGALLTAVAGLPALAALAAVSLSPAGFGETLRRWREGYEGRVPTALALTAEAPAAATPESPQQGFTDAEQIGRVAAFLRTIGLTGNFAPLVLMLGHGSDSRNNPHQSAYKCGACSGRHGGPNARVFSAMANRPAVRAGLVAEGIVIPAGTWFVAAEHNTCDDSVAWYDLDAVPAALQPQLDTLVARLAEACRAHAAERCRRFASAPSHLSPWAAKRHVAGRLHDLSQARPELGHATNAAAFIGRRAMSRGLFLDRRVFLISYDPTGDDDGRIVESILLAAGPVGAGIALEYYFSTVDNERFGAGSKIMHNLTGGFGVMEGALSDLRTGLPQQMVEVHEPMRLLVVVEQEPAVLSAVVARQPALAELIDNAWIVLAAKSPSTAAISLYYPGAGWQEWQGKTVLPQVGRSAEWFAGESEALAPAMVLGAAA